MKKSISRILALILAFVMILAFASCGKKDSAEEPANDPSNNIQNNDVPGNNGEETATGIQPGTSFIYWLNADIPSHVPWVTSIGAALNLNVYDNLLYKYKGDQNDIRGNLAESWDVSEDGLTWVFKIKEGVTFTSGNPVNAEAFVVCWDAAKEYQPRFFAPVESYEATGEYELTVKLSVASPTFIYDLPMQHLTGVVDPAALQEYGSEDNRAAIGCGPYYIEDYVSGQGFVLKANPDYHNADRMPTIETCELKIIPDENTALIALLNGEIDCMNNISVETYNVLEEEGWTVRIAGERVNPFWMNPNHNELFKDPVVREALCHMIDWEDVSLMVTDGLYPVPDGYWSGPGSVPYGDNYSYDPDLGLKMLADAGYKPEDIKFTMVAYAHYTNLVLAVQGQLQNLGLVNVEVETYDYSAAFGVLLSGEYDVIPTHNGYGVESPLTTYTMGLIPNGTQRCQWLEAMNAEDYEKALEHYDAAVAAADWDTYIENTEAITKLLQDNNAALGGVQQMSLYAYSDEFVAYEIPPIMTYMEFCYVAPAA